MKIRLKRRFEQKITQSAIRANSQEGCEERKDFFISYNNMVSDTYHAQNKIKANMSAIPRFQRVRDDDDE